MGPLGPRGFRRRGRRRGLVVGAAVGASMARRGQNDDQQQVDEPAAGDMTSQLQELQSLKEQGILTQEEFDAKKKQILGL